MSENYLEYWGKADPQYPAEPKWHPLVYHCLDVAAVAGAWWDESAVLRKRFVAAFMVSEFEEVRLRAWVLFFVALHDLGKFDARFQLVAPEALREAWPGLDPSDVSRSLAFDHGRWGYTWGVHECAMWTGAADIYEILDAWRPWLAAVAGHALPARAGMSRSRRPP
jgi:CRISPR-associated endonuclease/helicase Cas3